RRDVNRNVRRNDRREFPGAFFGEEDGLDREVAREQPPDDVLALGDEPFATAVELAVLEVAVVPDARVVERGDGLGHARRDVRHEKGDYIRSNRLSRVLGVTMALHRSLAPIAAGQRPARLRAW